MLPTLQRAGSTNLFSTRENSILTRPPRFSRGERQYESGLACFETSCTGFPLARKSPHWDKLPEGAVRVGNLHVTDRDLMPSGQPEINGSVDSYSNSLRKQGNSAGKTLQSESGPGRILFRNHWVCLTVSCCPYTGSALPLPASDAFLQITDHSTLFSLPGCFRFCTSNLCANRMLL